MIYYFKYRLNSEHPGPCTAESDRCSDIHEAKRKAIGLFSSPAAKRGEGYCEIFDRDPETGADPIETVLW